MSGIFDVTNLGAGPAQLLGVSIAFLLISWITVSARVWVRAVSIRSQGTDDYTIILAILAYTVECGYAIKLASTLMTPDKDETFPAVAAIVTNFISLSSAYAFTTIFLKISLAFFFLRIIIDKRQRMIIYVAMSVYSLYGLAYFGVTTFSCGNPNNFLLHQTEGTCLSIKDITVPMSYAQTALNGFTDWIFAILPLMTLYKLNMPKVTKIWACVLLALGAIGSVASLVRLKYIGGLVPGPEFFKTSNALAVWSVIEPGLGITAVSLATLRPMFKRCLESARNTTATPTGRSGTRLRIGANPSGAGDIPMNGLGMRSHIQGGTRLSISSDEGSEVELAQVTVKTDIEKVYE